MDDDDDAALGLERKVMEASGGVCHKKSQRLKSQNETDYGQTLTYIIHHKNS